MTLFEKLLSAGIKLTPMMVQYKEIKSEYPDTLLLYRMGDFYELFFDDAIKASKILNITLTHRGKIGGIPIPMAGIPHHAANTYIDRITSIGEKAAICEQIEDPKLAKGIVKRAVTQIVSPGIPFDIEKSEQNERRYISSAVLNKDGGYYLVLLDYITGDFRGKLVDSREELIEQISIYSPKELISYLGQWDNDKKIKEYFENSDILITNLSKEIWNETNSSIYIQTLIPTYKKDEILKKNNEILLPISAISYYITSTQSLEEICHIRPFQIENKKEKLIVTLPTLMGLEILPRNRELYKDSLLGYFDKTQTAMGGRELKTIFLNPLRDKKQILQRQNFIETLKNDYEKLKNIRKILSDVRDLERILTKISTKKTTPSDLLNLGAAISSYFEILNLLKLPQDLFNSFSSKEIKELKELSLRISDSINDEIGASLDKGNLIKSGVSKQRDKLCNIRKNRSKELLKLESRYRDETGISNLRIKYNNICGYFIEISKSHVSKITDKFERRQTLVNAERYLTQELNDFEKELLSSKDKLYRLEKELFDDIIRTASNTSTLIIKLSNTISMLDIFQSFAWIAIQDDLTKPEFQNEKKVIEVKNAWHPLIKSKIRNSFVPHNLKLDEETYFGLITGPNMAGKTTVMREIAIIQLLAQIGSFVPAESAKLGLCDYLFSRLGASDDIVRGQSTFMVEMSETSEIIRHATDKSLIILDEIGRGTSTYDGLSIAWALVEHLIEKTKALTLFSTHYHELIDLVSKTKSGKNLTVETINIDGNVKFLYRLIERGAHQSFGIYVAKLAGLPRELLFRAEEILKKLETEQKDRKTEIPKEKIKPIKFNQLEDKIQALDILNMTPIQAIDKLHELKSEITLNN